MLAYVPVSVLVLVALAGKKGAFDYLKVDYLLFQQVPKQHKFNPGQIFFGEEFGS